MDNREEEKEVELSSWTATATSFGSNSEPVRLLIVSCSKDGAELLSSVPSQNLIKGALFVSGVNSERNSWGCSLGTGAGATLTQISPGVLGIDLSNVGLDVSYLDLVHKLFSMLGSVPTDGVVVLDRKFSYASSVSMMMDVDSDYLGVEGLPALLVSTKVGMPQHLAKFPSFLPPNILTGWAAALLTHCESNSIPCHVFVAQNTNQKLFAESKVLELFGVQTSSLESKLAGVKLESTAGKPEVVPNALFL
ncbi:hypothetical protein HDU79_008982 [Rhizoclosmatium sp. JEL0117]|nr:hypothetical protein HDU79_008982 [Rhizoclosmatium sp. JEL0117]